MPIIPRLPPSAYKDLLSPSQPAYQPPSALPNLRDLSKPSTPNTPPSTTNPVAAPPQASPGGVPIPQLQPLQKPVPQQLPFAEPPPKPLKLIPNLKPLPEAATPTTNPMSLPSSAVPGAAVGSGGVAVGMLQLSLVVVAAGLMMHNAQQLMKLWQLSQPEALAKEPDLYGGQGEDLYVISGEVTEICANEPDYSDAVEVTWYFNRASSWALTSRGIPGPLTLLSKVGTETGGKPWFGVGFRTPVYPTPIPVAATSIEEGKNSSHYNRFHCKLTRISLTAHPINEEPQPQPQPQLQPKRQPIQTVNTSPELLDYPEKPKLQIIPNIAPTPHAQPQPLVQPTDKPLEENKRFPIKIVAPANKPITISSASGQPITIPASPEPKEITISRDEPTIKIQQPNQPQVQPIILTYPATDPVVVDIPGQEPIKYNPVTKNFPQGLQPNPEKENKPKVIPTPQPQPQPQPSPIVNPDLIPIGTGLVTITQLLQGIDQKLKPTIKEATCELVKPDGCLSDMNGNAQKAADTSAQNQDLLNKLNLLLQGLQTGLLAKIDATTVANGIKASNIQDKLGTAKYPLILPEYLLDDHLDKPITINDQVDFNIWSLKQWDALIGLFPIKIERTDENGNKQMLKFENIAEAIAEITGLLATIAFDADTSVNVGVHATAEAIGAKVAAVQASSQLKSIIDYLGFQGSHKPLNISISCTPGAVGLDGKLQETELKDFLKPSTQRAIGWECNERDDLHSILKRILFDSEIARAALYKPLKPPTSSASSITGDAIREEINKEKQREDDEWEKFKTRIKNQEGTNVDIDLEERPLNNEGTT